MPPNRILPTLTLIFVFALFLPLVALAKRTLTAPENLLASRELRNPFHLTTFGLNNGSGFQTLVFSLGSGKSSFVQDDYRVPANPTAVFIQTESLNIVSSLQIGAELEGWKKIRSLSSLYVFDISTDAVVPLPVGLQLGIGPAGSSISATSLIATAGIYLGSASGFELGYLLQLPITHDERPDWLVKHSFMLRIAWPSGKRGLEVWKRDLNEYPKLDEMDRH